MWVDLLIVAPVTLFLLWLYVYSAPRRRSRRLRILDRCVLVGAPGAVVAIVVGGHAWIDYPGMGLNVMLVAAAYVVLVVLLGLGWWARRNAAKDLDKSERQS